MTIESRLSASISIRINFRHQRIEDMAIPLNSVLAVHAISVVALREEKGPFNIRADVALAFGEDERAKQFT